MRAVQKVSCHVTVLVILTMAGFFLNSPSISEDKKHPPSRHG